MDKLINLVKQFLGRMKEDKKLLYTVIGVTAAMLAAVVALIVVLYMLISQLVDFIVSIYGEVVYRFVKRV